MPKHRADVPPRTTRLFAEQLKLNLAVSAVILGGLAIDGVLFGPEANSVLTMDIVPSQPPAPVYSPFELPLFPPTDDPFLP